VYVLHQTPLTIPELRALSDAPAPNTPSLSASRTHGSATTNETWEARVREPEGARDADSSLAEHIATEAGRALVELRERVGLTGDAGSLGADGDRIAHALILQLLRQSRPDDAVLSEEGADDRMRLQADRVWIVDPLDGTREYAERTENGWRGDWAVHVALWTREAGVRVGAVAIPARGQTFGTGAPAVLSQLPAPASGALRLAVSRSHPAPVVDFLRDRLEVELVPMGSAGVKAMAVVTGDVDGYVHDGGQYEWDSAAPVAVARAAGLVAHRLDGSPLVYNRENPWLPDLMICRPSVAARLDAVLSTRPPERMASE
jgi:3'(2'), 5'-bisphosphate nucleotidase